MTTVRRHESDYGERSGAPRGAPLLIEMGGETQDRLGATQLLEQGVHPKVATAALGHSCESFTQRQYQHFMDGSLTESAARAIAAAFSPTPLAIGLQSEAGHAS